jgi:hypothetical protein
MMLWTPTARLLILQAAVRMLPTPVRATAPHPVSATLFSEKRTLPVGLDPVIEAMNVTEATAGAGLPELVNDVVVVGKPVAAAVQASISMMREYEARALVTLTRMRSVVNAGNATLRLTRLLPLTAASVTHAEPFQPCTEKS